VADDPSDIAAFKKISRSDPTFDDLPRLEAEIYGANDRACAVMLGSVTETSLTIFLRARLRPAIRSADRRAILDFNGPCGTFSAKTLVAFGFNFFGPETRSDLDLIRTIRNEFAHSRKSFDFTLAELKPVCDRLQSPDWPGAFIPHAYLNNTNIPLEIVGDKTHPKTRYVSACHVISERLLDHSDIVGATKTKDLR
jgi:hypothetical protein